MSKVERLDKYHFYTRDWEEYDELYEWFDWTAPEQFNIADYVVDRWASDPERIALFHDAENTTPDERTITFRQLRDETNRFANYLTNLGIERGDRVAINASQRPETLIAHVATWKVGAVSVPLSTLFGRDAMAYRLNDCDASVCFVERSNLDTIREVQSDVPSLERTIVLGDVTTEPDEDGYRNVLDTHSPEFETVPTSPEDDAIIAYTSGTTGKPKGVLHAHRFVLGSLPIFVLSSCNLTLEPNDRFWAPSDWSWLGTLFVIVFPALFYGKPVLAYESGEFDPEATLEQIERHELTNVHAPPTALRMLTRVNDPSAQYDLDTVRNISTGGEAVTEETRRTLNEVFDGVTVHERYGQTEVCGFIGECTALGIGRDGFMGRPIPGHNVGLVERGTTNKLSEPGEVGEIAVEYEGNLFCMKEYWNDPDATADKIIDGWLLTEDLGTRTTDGYYAFKSRKDDVIISSGYRMGPEEIEDTVVKHDAVDDCGVVGVSDETRGTIPKAFVVVTDDSEPSQSLRESIQQFVKDRLAQYEYPREIEFIESLPKTYTGKIRREPLKEETD
ncbi:acyl-CoA synthetase [Natrarchaeobius chitinivorans]|uniref:AMP-dependent synthetase n=1 Tax=Natrarchaeobius chitinivorans TaxID=1679083 RepID=A0A3N6P996_NATCH|nr:AMP-binding protein [Natrarchaeobius chitinivorans]RQG95439.1 AMP-dependent synthetase [Natrarchaeobius chitinivorans]